MPENANRLTPPMGDPPAAVLDLLRSLIDDAGHQTLAKQRLVNLIGHSLAVNESLNLTAVREAGDFWVRHIEDALLAGEILQRRLGPSIRRASILDVGSGGGIPGLIWAILWPEATVHLLEARGKKARFLEEAASRLGLDNVSVLDGRAEDLARQAAHRDAYDLVTARALAAMAVLGELTLGFVKPGGWLGAIKGEPFAEEWAQARGCIEAMGGDSHHAQLEPYARSDGKSCLLCLIPKVLNTPERYPRRAGVPERKPLTGL